MTEHSFDICEARSNRFQWNVDNAAILQIIAPSTEHDLHICGGKIDPAPTNKYSRREAKRRADSTATVAINEISEFKRSSPTRTPGRLRETGFSYRRSYGMPAKTE